MTTVTISESPITVAATEEVVTVSVSSQEVSVSVTEGASVDHDHDDDYEPALGNPAADGYVLSSTAAGVRSWIELMSGGGAEFPWQPDSDGAHSILQNAAGTADVLSVDTTNLDLILYRTGGLRPDANSSAWPLVQNASGTSMLDVNTSGGDIYVRPNSAFEMAVNAPDSGNTYSSWTMGHRSQNLKLRLQQIPNDGSAGITWWLNQFSMETPQHAMRVAMLQNGTTNVPTYDNHGIIGTSTNAPTYLIAYYKYMVGLIPSLNEVQIRAGYTLVAQDGVKFVNLPTSDPAVAGQLWNDGGTLKVSEG